MTGDEEKFVRYWQQHRLGEKKIFRQWLVGLPIGLAFGTPIFISFYSGWYKRANMWTRSHSEGGGLGIVLAIAFCAIATFIAIFHKKQQWDRREQQYQEVMGKLTPTERSKLENDFSKSSE
jgi:polyferredoxin